MSMVEADVRVSNPAGGDYYKASMLVDTGATHSKLPASLLREIGVEPDQTEAFSFPDTTDHQFVPAQHFLVGIRGKPFLG